MELNRALFNISQHDLDEIMVELEKKGQVFNKAEKDVAYIISQYNLYIYKNIEECYFGNYSRYKNPINNFREDREDLENYLKFLCVVHFKNSEPKSSIFEKIYMFIKNKIAY